VVLKDYSLNVENKELGNLEVYNLTFTNLSHIMQNIHPRKLYWFYYKH